MEWITVLGLTAAAFTTASILPQAAKTIRTKQTGDISVMMYIILVSGVCLWLAYGIFIGDLPIILANSFTLVFSGTVLGLKIRYG